MITYDRHHALSHRGDTDAGAIRLATVRQQQHEMDILKWKSLAPSTKVTHPIGLFSGGSTKERGSVQRKALAWLYGTVTTGAKHAVLSYQHNSGKRPCNVELI